ncbi:3-deoxy-D-manno-octulosonic-acid transferase [Dyella sp. SG562]|uniref:lipid IV(A) 3-deoxy-D-manno-octulosonic acid transferase n=1 Tax=Dyella TaxID=231454 RepID=UPI001420E161|nr:MULTISPECIES: lipid IV(A) 3-deoxy-D-manno-octulosonic acid transferase [unclassified Dyella]NII73601.1 3-deoxy-D-manno-octulosonic-acid transferase [Dyella sp. SG562]NKJ23094.1 3-deoxy-D-manno-octulosonic-acid transferase [Dyella sp. SG609]
MRYLYTLAMYLVTPIIVMRLLARGVRYRDYHRRWRERFGFYRGPTLRGSIWVHAVSVGEVNAAEPLIKSLREAYVNAPLVVTTVTPTGSERVRQLFGDSVYHVYLPYDLPFAVSRFMQRVRPRLAIIVETEIWPNLYFACKKRGIPLMIVNARLSERSLRGYRPLQGLVRSALSCVRQIAAQSRTDAARYRLLGVEPARIVVSGNLKFDMPVPYAAVQAGEELRRQWGHLRPVWIAGSTHEGEELPVLEAHLQVLKRLPDALLLIAPRHPERFKLVESAVRSLGFSMATRSADRVPTAAHQVFVIDAMGELMQFYAAADLAFVGGSLVPIGGHNVLEPAALSRPVLVGPHTFNFEEITLTLIGEGAAVRLNDASELGTAVLQLLRDAERRKSMGLHAQVVFDRERGAVQRVMELIDKQLQE